MTNITESVVLHDKIPNNPINEPAPNAPQFQIVSQCKNPHQQVDFAFMLNLDAQQTKICDEINTDMEYFVKSISTDLEKNSCDYLLSE